MNNAYNIAYDIWYEDNRDFLTANNIPKAVAEIIWDSARAEVAHNLVSSIQDGSIKIKLSF